MSLPLSVNRLEKKREPARRGHAFFTIELWFVIDSENSEFAMHPSARSQFPDSSEKPCFPIRISLDQRVEGERFQNSSTGPKKSYLKISEKFYRTHHCSWRD